MSEPAITDLPMWAKGREKDHKEKDHKDKTNHGHTKGEDNTGDEPDPSCCTPVEPDPDPDGG